MVAVAGEVADLDPGVGQSFDDQPFDVSGLHGHVEILVPFSPWPAQP